MTAEALRHCSGPAEGVSAMGSILSFKPRTAAMRPKPRPAGTEASVVIFPGVRYERGEASAPRRMPGVAPLRVAEAPQEFPAPRR